MKINKADLASYARHLVVLLVGAVAVLDKTTGKTPLEYTKADFIFLANSLWVSAVMPAAKKWWAAFSK